LKARRRLGRLQYLHGGAACSSTSHPWIAKIHMAFDPVDVSGHGADTVVFEPQAIPHAIEQASRLLQSNRIGSLAIRLVVKESMKVPQEDWTCLQYFNIQLRINGRVSSRPPRSSSSSTPEEMRNVKSFDLSLSHSAKDKTVVRPLAEQLRANSRRSFLR
jgi:hypothetical protein